MGVEYLNNSRLQEVIANYRKTKDNPKTKAEFAEAEMELTKSFYLLTEKIFLAYKYMFGNGGIDKDDVLQEGTMICFEKIHRFNCEIGKAFPFFTQIIVNHFKQLCRGMINYRNLTMKYHQHLCDQISDPYARPYRNVPTLPNRDNPEN